MTSPRLHVVQADPVAQRRQVRSLRTVEGRVRHYEQELIPRGLAVRTVANYTRRVRRAELWCEQHGYTLRNVPALVLGNYVEQCPRTQANLRVLKSALALYWKVFPRKNPPLWMVRVPRRSPMVCKALDETQAGRLAAYARHLGGRQGLAVLLGLYQGLRREEISAVRWDDIHDDGWLNVVGKGNKEARIPLHPVVSEALGAWKCSGLLRASPWVFPGRFHDLHRPHVTPATIWKWVIEVAEGAGIGHVTPHRLRHTALATANDNTGDLRAVQDFARHSRPDTTAGYTRTTVRRLIAVMNAINYDPGAGDRLELERRFSAKLSKISTDDLAVLVQLVDELVPN